MLSLERATGNVPSDGKYHIRSNGIVICSFNSFRAANERFKQLVTVSGYKPNPPHARKPNPGDESIERYLLAKAIFWAEGPKYRGKTGKGGRGGV